MKVFGDRRCCCHRQCFQLSALDASIQITGRCELAELSDDVTIDSTSRPIDANPCVGEVCGAGGGARGVGSLGRAEDAHAAFVEVVEGSTGFAHGGVVAAGVVAWGGAPVAAGVGAAYFEGEVGGDRCGAAGGAGGEVRRDVTPASDA